MPTAIPDARSGIDNENLQEVIDAAVSAEHALQNGQQQYQTPDWLAEGCVRLLDWAQPYHILDPQCASGRLLTPFHSGVRCGWEIDRRFEHADSIQRIRGNCVAIAATLADIAPYARFHAIVANPPFAIRWKRHGQLPPGSPPTIDSTLWTWQLQQSLTTDDGVGFLIAARATLERLGIHQHPTVYLYQTFPPGLWENTEVVIGVVHFCRTHRTGPVLTRHWEGIPDSGYELALTLRHVRPTGHTGRFAYTSSPSCAFPQVQDIVTEESRTRPAYNIYLGPDGALRTYLSTRARIKFKSEDIARLHRADGAHPLTLTTERETRKLLEYYATSGVYTIDPKALEAIQDALRQAAAHAVPLRPVTDFELVAYADEEDHLTARTDFLVPHVPAPGGRARCLVPGVEDYTGAPSGPILTPGTRYELRTGTYRFTEKFTRKKLHTAKDEQTGKEWCEVRDHQCSLSGSDRYIKITDDRGTEWRFLDRPQTPTDIPESALWQLFERPTVRTVAELYPERIEQAHRILNLQEALAGFTYFAGQRDFITRIATKDYGLVAADVGTGKTLMALTLISLKSPRRTLLIAPQGTMRSTGDEEGEDYHASQWVTEIQRFAPTEPVFQLFSEADYHRILSANDGTLPHGVYISYPQAMFYNGAFEWLPSSWTTSRVSPAEAERRYRDRMGLPALAPVNQDKITAATAAGQMPPPPRYDPESFLHDGIGREQDGIRCLAAPALATLIGPVWDMVLLDEGHLICNLDARVTQSFIRLQPRFRYVLTATPIPNIVSNLFSIMGWLCVPDWHRGGRRNAAWPYAADELGRFEATFLALERDHTAEAEARSRGVRKATCARPSPIISSPARLLKILRPTLAYISKQECNPDLQPCQVVDVRVPLGVEQGRLYAWYTDRSHIPYDNPLTKALVQMTWLRGICADPATCDYNRAPAPVCRSNFNPKIIAALQIIAERLAAGEQVTVVCARVGQSTAIATRLMEAGIPISRIDSTIDACEHAAQAAAFKEGRTRVLLMGVKCAQGHSFDQCPNLIVLSLEWSYGTLHQAKGRVWRLTSPKPVKVWVILHQGTIEELLFDRVALKQDAATICLHGQRVPRDFRTVDPSEILAEHIVHLQDAGPDGALTTLAESQCEDQWPALRTRLALAA